MSTINLVVHTNESSGNIISGVNFKKGGSNFLENLSKVCQPTAIEYTLLNGNAGKASGTITIDNAKIAENDIINIGGQAFTAKAAGAGANEFNIGVDATGTAANLVSAFNASMDAQVFNATSAAGVVTIQCLLTGKLGNFVGMVKTEAVSGAFTLSAATLTSGSDDTATTIVYR